jgi:type II secretory pathway component GspD/PulD (secretin)
MSIGNSTLVYRSVRSLLTAAGLAGGVVGFGAGVGAFPNTLFAQTSSLTGATAADQIVKAADLMSAGKAVAAKSILVELSTAKHATTLTTNERSRVFTMLANANRRIKSMNPIDVSLQTAEDCLLRSDLKTLARHAEAVIDSPKATNEQTAIARDLLAKAELAKAVLVPSLPTTLAQIQADFDSGNILAAKDGIDALSRAGLPLSMEQQHLVDSMALRIVETEQVNGADAAALGMMQPGVIKPRPSDTPGAPSNPDQPAATEPAPVTPAPVASEPAAQPMSQPSGDPVEMARKWQASSIIAEADQAFEQARMAEASEKYQQVLAGFTNELTQEQRSHVENRLAEAKVRLGVNVGTEGQVIPNYLGQVKLKRDQAVAEFSNNVEQAQKALASGDVANARNLASTARVNINSVREVFSTTDVENYNKQVDDLLTSIDTRAAEIAATDKEATARQLAQATATAQARATSDKDRKISEAIDRVRALQREMKYDEALQVVDQILFLDSINPVGLVLRDVLSDARVYQRSGRLDRAKNRAIAEQNLQNMDALVSPEGLMSYPSDWPALTVRRGQPLGLADSEENRSALALLERKRIPVKFTDTPFANVVSFLNAVTQLNFDVDWEKLTEAGINRETQISLELTNVPVRTVLERVLEKVSTDASNGAAYAINDGVVTISTREAINKVKTLQVYDLSDLLIEFAPNDDAPEFDLDSVLQSGSGGGGGQSPFQDNQEDDEEPRTIEEKLQDLIPIITTNVDQQGWQENGGDVGYIQQYKGSLIITNTPANHRAINGLLTKLRELRAMQINVETRFLLVRTDYFEQIGFDLDVYFNGDNNQVRAAQAAIPNGSVQPSDFFNFSQGGLQRRVFGAPTDANGDGTPDPVVGIATPLPSPLSVIGAGQNSLGQTEQLTSGSFAQGILSRAPALGVGGQFLDDIQVDFLIKATQADRRTVGLTAPRLTFINGERAYIQVATQVAFVSDLQPVVSESAVGFDPTLANVSEGVILSLTGVVSADRRYVTFDINTSLGRIEGFQNTAISAIAGGGLISSSATQSFIQRPTVTVTQIKTQATIPDQGTLLLGGQRLITEQEIESGVPVLSKIPIINRFFSNRIEVKEEQTLLILLKPTILIQNEEEDRFFPGLAESVKFGG